MPSKRQRVSDIAKADEAVGKGMLSHLGTSSPRVHIMAWRGAPSHVLLPRPRTTPEQLHMRYAHAVLRGALCVY